MAEITPLTELMAQRLILATTLEVLDALAPGATADVKDGLKLMTGFRSVLAEWEDGTELTVSEAAKRAVEMIGEFEAMRRRRH